MFLMQKHAHTQNNKYTKTIKWFLRLFGLYLLGQSLLQALCDMDKPKDKEHLRPKKYVWLQTHKGWSEEGTY